MWTISTTVAITVCASVVSPHARPLSSTRHGRSILPRNRLTCRISVFTHDRSLANSS